MTPDAAKRTLLGIDIPRDELALRIACPCLQMKPTPGQTATEALDKLNSVGVAPGMTLAMGANLPSRCRRCGSLLPRADQRGEATVMTPDALRELASRVEQATGPDTELDVAVVYALYPDIGPYRGLCIGDDPIFWHEPSTRERSVGMCQAMLKAERERWQPIETAPLHKVIDLWVASEQEDGWRKTGELIADDPHCLIDEDGRTYWPHEDGGWFTHWMPLPLPPVTDEG